jgi:CRISPR-associated protein Cst2
VTLDLHNLNSEGTEGNQQQTRMVHIIDQSGHRAIVNAVSGDMFKHILVEHLVPLLKGRWSATFTRRHSSRCRSH